jgi:CBS domain containing-hemolysin-like protein
MPLWAGILGFVLCIAIATFYGAALVAFAALGRELHERQRSRQERQNLTGFMLRDSGPTTAAWVVGGFLFGLASAAMLAEVAAALLAPAPPGLRVLAAAALVDTACIVAGLMAWKSWAEAAPHAYCVAAAALVLPVYVLVYPFRRWLGTAMARLYPTSTLQAGLLLAEDVKEMTENGEHAHLLDDDEREMIQRVFLLGETVVREIMVPRIDMVALDESASFDEIVHVVKKSRHSRLPVYRGNMDNIVGFLHIKDLVSMLGNSNASPWTSLMRPAYFVPETKRADQLLKDLRDRRMHLAIVVDEYGGTSGLVTLEDVIEEVVGEIQDESDKELPLIDRLEDGSFRVDPKVNLTDLNEHLGVGLPADDFDTLAGYLYGLAGKIPAPGDRYSGAGLEFTVAGVHGKRITSVIVRPQPTDAVGGESRSR